MEGEAERPRKSLSEATYAEMEAAQGHAGGGTHTTAGVGGRRQQRLPEGADARVIPTWSEEVTSLDSSDQSERHRQSQGAWDWSMGGRQEGRPG